MTALDARKSFACSAKRGSRMRRVRCSSWNAGARSTTDRHRERAAVDRGTGCPGQLPADAGLAPRALHPALHFHRDASEREKGVSPSCRRCLDKRRSFRNDSRRWSSCSDVGGTFQAWRSVTRRRSRSNEASARRRKSGGAARSGQRSVLGRPEGPIDAWERTACSKAAGLSGVKKGLIARPRSSPREVVGTDVDPVAGAADPGRGRCPRPAPSPHARGYLGAVTVAAPNGSGRGARWGRPAVGSGRSLAYSDDSPFVGVLASDQRQDPAPGRCSEDAVHQGPVVQLGVHAGLSSRRSRVQIPSGPPRRVRFRGSPLRRIALRPRSGSSVGRARA